MAGLDAHYSARDIEARILAAVRAAGLNPEQRLSPEELGALDHFHTGGLRASRELLELAQIRAEDRVLDIGAGLAGPARLLASALGCRVDCVETVARLLRRRGAAESADRPRRPNRSARGQRARPALSRRFVRCRLDAERRHEHRGQAEALRGDPPGPQAGRPVRLPGDGRRGQRPTSYFPLPWATDPADSFLVSAEEMRSASRRELDSSPNSSRTPATPI